MIRLRRVVSSISKDFLTFVPSAAYQHAQLISLSSHVLESHGPQHLYEALYCARGDMENRIKEQQLGLLADRTSCQKWWPNQFRLILSGIAYVLLETLRRHYLQGTEYARSQVGTIRLKILRVGAVVIRKTRRIKILVSIASNQNRGPVIFSKKLFRSLWRTKQHKGISSPHQTSSSPEKNARFKAWISFTHGNVSFSCFSRQGFSQQ